MLSLLQKHTIDLYNLEEKHFQKLNIDAVSLLKSQRFDLFAKLFYIKYKESNPKKALKVYTEHLKAFNSNLKEPGRDDKNNLDDFINTFNQLINHFKDNDFDQSISLVPISEKNVILDASHRIAALAYYNRKVTVLKFNEVHPVTEFDYLYFKKRGLTNVIADSIAYTSLEYLSNICIVCLYFPKEQVLKSATDFISLSSSILYARKYRLSVKGVEKLVNLLTKNKNSEVNHLKINKKQSVNIQIILFNPNSEEQMNKLVLQYRNRLQFENGIYYISKNSKDVRELVELFFTEKVNDFSNIYTRSLDNADEFGYLFLNLYVVRFKTFIAQILKRIGIYQK